MHRAPEQRTYKAPRYSYKDLAELYGKHKTTIVKWLNEEDAPKPESDIVVGFRRGFIPKKLYDITLVAAYFKEKHGLEKPSGRN